MTWYPREELITYIHDQQIAKYGGRLGFHRDPSLLAKIISETKRRNGDTYSKAAFLLRTIITSHIFKDGQHRTAFVVTEMFLRENKQSIHCNYQQARMFLKNIRSHNVEEIARWLRHGDPRRERESSPNHGATRHPPPQPQRRNQESHPLSHKTPALVLILVLVLTQIILATTPTQAQAPKQLSITVICFEFPDVSHSATIETIRKTAIDQVNTFYQEASYGQFSITGQIYGWYMMPAPLSKFDVCKWGSPSEACSRLLQVAQSVADNNKVSIGAYTFFVFSGSVWGFAHSTLRISVQNEKHAWYTYAHELGHIIGLLDLYSYGEARTGGDSSIFAGSWDLMSVSSSGTMCAWSRIKTGWIQKNQITTLDMTSSVTISPLQLGKGILAARIEYTYSVVRYYLVEVRQGYGVLITDIDETRAGGEGIVRVMDAHPESKALSDACLNLYIYTATPVYFNPYRTMAIILLDKIGDDYKITLGTIDSGEKALEAHKNLQSAKSSINKAQSEIRIEGLDQANSTLDRAMSSYQEGRFADSSLLAQNAKTLADKATIPKIYYEAKQMIETTENRFKMLSARKFESSEAVAKRDDATTMLSKSRDAFKSLQFESTLTDLTYCNSLISEAERLEQDFQTRKSVTTSTTSAAIVIVAVSISLLLFAKRRAKNHQ